ncbi:MAG: serine--tRNA ligase [Candidatus Helarchaeota archaeon]
MPSTLKAEFLFNKDISAQIKEIKQFLDEFKTGLEKKHAQKDMKFTVSHEKDKLKLEIFYDTGFPHAVLFQLRNKLNQNFGKKHRLTVKKVVVSHYKLQFGLEKSPLHDFTIPYVDDFKLDEDKFEITFSKPLEESFVKKNFVNRIVRRIREKIDQQYYAGKGEFAEILWASEKKEPIWNEDPSRVMVEKGWLQLGRTKGKWFFGPQITKIIRAMEQIVKREIIKPLGFQEVIEPHHESFSTLLKTGHLEGVPMEVYYVCEPKTRNPEEWETFIDYLKISREVPYEELSKLLSPPNAINCYVQCPNIYEFFSGKTIGDDQFPILVYDRSAVSNRYESGGRHGIERMDEFHRMELVYIGTMEQLVEVKDKIIEKYKYIFNDILDLEWRMAWVTPFYLQHSGILELDDAKQRIKGTIDFEAYLPYRGTREDSEWLEFQNLSIVGDKYTKAFNIKAQRLDLWSGCSGIGLERWSVAFLAQKGLDPDNWPKKFRKEVGDLPKIFNFF